MPKKRKLANELKRRFIEIGDLPKELVTSYSRMVLLGDSEFTIENYSGIIEYETNKVRIKSVSGVICITGEDFVINELDNDSLFVKGKIRNIEIEE